MTILHGNAQMNHIKNLEKAYAKNRTKYFRDNFLGRDINYVLHFVTKEITKDLIKSYLKMNIIKDCIDTIKDDKHFDDKTKQNINDTFKCINSYCIELESALNSIYKGIVE